MPGAGVPPPTPHRIAPDAEPGQTEDRTRAPPHPQGLCEGPRPRATWSPPEKDSHARGGGGLASVSYYQ